MNEFDNINNIADGLEDAPMLAKLQKKNSLSVPEGYFDTLEGDIMSKIGSSMIEDAPKKSISHYLYYVAAASVVVILSFIIFSSKNDNPESNFIAIDNQKIEIPVANPDNKLVNADQQKITEQRIDNSKIETVNPKGKAIIANNKLVIKLSDPQSAPTPQKNTPIQKYKETIEEAIVAIDNTVIDDNYKSLAIANTGARAVSTNYGQHNISSSARISNIEDSENLILAKDTCLNKAFVINIPQDSIYQNLDFVWNDGSTKSSFNVSQSGVYFLEMYKEGKLMHTDTLKVNIIPFPEPNIAPEVEMCNHQSVLINTGLNDKVYHHNWSLEHAHSSEILLENLEPGVTDLVVTIASCCDTITEVIALNVQDCRIEIPNVITPNGDGYNDAFVVKGLDYYPNSSLNIFDRNGKLIYQSLDYRNDWKADGVTSGNYFYSIIINDKLHTEKGGVIKVMR